jgi:hypothetical protein
MFADLPLNDVNPETVDALGASGGLLPEGKYHARLDGAAPVTSRTSGNDGTELTFCVLAGPFAGQEVKETLWVSDKTTNRVVLFGARLGALKVDPATKKYVPAEGKNTFQDCLGAEVVIEVCHREYTKKDNTKGKAANITFGGIFDVNDKAAKDVVKLKAGATKPAAPKPKPAVDTKGI